MILACGAAGRTRGLAFGIIRSKIGASDTMIRRILQKHALCPRHILRLHPREVKASNPMQPLPGIGKRFIVQDEAPTDSWILELGRSLVFEGKSRGYRSILLLGL
jgi:hypothetical protein